jgi:hypothetical protein
MHPRTITGDTPMRTDCVIDEIRQLRTARNERIGDSAQAWRADIVSQRLALEAQGGVFAAQIQKSTVQGPSADAHNALI